MKRVTKDIAVMPMTATAKIVSLVATTEELLKKYGRTEPWIIWDLKGGVRGVG